MREKSGAARAAIFFTAAAFIAASAAAQDAAPAADDKARAQIESCETYKFETSAKVTVDGKSRRMNVKLCGTEAKSDADWVRTLEDAVEKVGLNDRFPPEAKEQIVAALKMEIAKYAAAEPVQQTAFDLKSKPARTTAGPPVEYSALPPMPKPLPPQPAIAAAKPAPVAASVPPRPRLSFSCYNPGDIGSGGPCMALVRETVITVQADAALAGGHKLRFLRRGEPLGEVALAALRKGRSARVGVPRALCAGVVGSRIEVEVVHSGQVLDTVGPLELRC